MRRLVPFLLLAGCTADPGAHSQHLPAVALGQEFTLARGQGVSLEGTPYRVWFHDVIEDSRCAVDTTCVWEGNARVSVHLVADDQSLELELDTSPRIPTQPRDGDIQLQVVRLEPAPRAGIQTTGYSLTLLAREQ